MRNTYFEFIRGAAALLVMFGHLIKLNGMQEHFGNTLMLINWGTEAVIVFFLLSGTVIKLSMGSNPRSKLSFFQRRIARIVPIYIVVVVLTILVSLLMEEVPSLSVIVGHFLFLQTLQGYIVPTMPANAALWSLSFEFFFYSVYTFTIGKHQKRLLTIWAVISLVAVFLQAFFLVPGILGHLNIMFAYSSIWLLGYHLVDLAKYIKIGSFQTFAWLGLLPMVARLNFSENFYLAAKHFIVSLTIVPLFIFLLEKAQIANSRTNKTQLKWIFWLIIYTILVVFTYNNRSLFLSKIIYIFTPLLMVIITYFIQQLPIKKTGIYEQGFLMLGQVSYPLYAVHVPIIFLVNFIPVNLQTKIILVLTVSSSFAYILEFYIHPPLSHLILSYKKTNN